jgi:hypothetical protein
VNFLVKAVVNTWLFVVLKKQQLTEIRDSKAGFQKKV